MARRISGLLGWQVHLKDSEVRADTHTGEGDHRREQQREARIDTLRQVLDYRLDAGRRRLCQPNHGLCQLIHVVVQSPYSESQILEYTVPWTYGGNTPT